MGRVDGMELERSGTLSDDDDDDDDVTNDDDDGDDDDFDGLRW